MASSPPKPLEMNRYIYKLRTLLIVVAIGPPALAFFLYAWMRGGLADALDLVAAIGFLAWSAAGIHFAIKQNLGY